MCAQEKADQNFHFSFASGGIVSGNRKSFFLVSQLSSHFVEQIFALNILRSGIESVGGWWCERASYSLSHIIPFYIFPKNWNRFVFARQHISSIFAIISSFVCWCDFDVECVAGADMDFFLQSVSLTFFINWQFTALTWFAKNFREIIFWDGKFASSFSSLLPSGNRIKVGRRNRQSMNRMCWQ